MKALLHYWPSMITLCVILYATWLPDPLNDATLPLIPHIDKLIHAIMFGGMTGALLFDYKRKDKQRQLTRRVIATCVAIVVVLSVIDEIVQGLLPIGRPFDFFDLIADWTGIIIARLSAPPVINLIFR